MELVPLPAEALVVAARELVLAGPVFISASGLMTRVVTLAMGTASALVRVRVSMVAVTDMPGRNSARSVKRMRTWNWVADCPEPDDLLKLPTLKYDSNPAD